MYILAIISFICLALNLAVSTIKQGYVPDCVSRCWYVIKWWHYAFLMSAAGFLMPCLLEITPVPYQALAFFTCAGVLFVGTAPNYLGNEKIIHFASAITSVVCSLLWGILVNPWSLLGCLIILMVVFDKNRRLLYFELACFLSIYLGVIFSVI